MPPRDLSTFQSILTQSSLTSSFPISLLLIGLEALIEHEFSCPCSGDNWNTFITAVVFVTPILFACALIFFYSTFYKNTDIKETKCAYLTNYLIPICVWLFVMLLDGQYVACTLANWKGGYVFNEKLKKKWCEPSETKNPTELQELQKGYENNIFWSQFAGYCLIATISIFIIGESFWKCCKACTDQKVDSKNYVMVVAGPNQGETIEVQIAERP